MTPLSFATLRKANTLRLPQFRNSRGEPAHSKPDGSDWSKGEWMNAILGEFGEVANLVKKVKRGDMPLEAALQELSMELADVVTYTDLTAFQFGLSFDDHIDFGIFRAMSADIFNACEGEFSLGEWMNKAFAYYGVVAQITAQSHGNIIGITNAKTTIRNNFVNALICIDCAAIKIGCDLGIAVVRKFNFVSSRVKADVFINSDDSITNIHGGLL